VAEYGWWADDWLGRAPHLIGGEWLPVGGTITPVVDPYTERAIGEVGEAGPQLVEQAVAAAVAAGRSWSRTDPQLRADLLDRLARLIEEHSTELAGLVTREMGMPAPLARASQGDLPPRVLRSFAALARTTPWRERVDGAELIRLPRGVVAAITPWNMPVHQIVAKIGAALAAGNTVVLKPSEQTPFDAVALGELCAEAGFPPGVLNIVHGTGPSTGSALAASPGIDYVSFTGSVAAGRTVAELAARHLAPVTLELGGKSPAVILPDADLPLAIPAAVRAGMVNSGQACNATTRLVVPREHAAEVTELVTRTLRSLKPGDPKQADTTFGPLSSARHRDRVLAQLDTAAGSAALLAHESDLPGTGFFVAPRVFTDLHADSPLLRQEIFGPVLALQWYSDVDEAARLADDSDYGLSAEVWSADVDRAAEFARRLRVGQVKINGVRTRERPAVPFGGFKLSGFGRELGAEGLLEMTTVQAVMS
jgi:aldehyde dehydrogenase (NAD+)